MPPQIPSPDNNYEFPSNWPLTKGNLQPIIRALHQRLIPLEAQTAELQEVIDSITTQGLAYIAEVVGPAVAELEAQLDEVQEAADLILAQGVSATNVQETVTRVFVTPAQKTDLGALRTEWNAFKASANALYDTLTEIGAAIAAVKVTADAALPAANKASDAEATAGTDDAKYVTVAKVKKAAFKIGDIVRAEGSSPGTGWLKCDGGSYLQSAYPDLWTAIGHDFVTFLEAVTTSDATSPNHVLWDGTQFVTARSISTSNIDIFTQASGVASPVNRSSTTTATELLGLFKCGSRFLAPTVGSGSNGRLSTNATAWSALPDHGFTTLYTFAYGNGRSVFGGDASPWVKIMLDGGTVYANATTVAASRKYQLSYASHLTKFVCLNGASQIETSTDGLVWATQTAPAGVTNGWKISYIGGKIVFWQTGNSVCRQWITTDLINFVSADYVIATKIGGHTIRSYFEGPAALPMMAGQGPGIEYKSVMTYKDFLAPGVPRIIAPVSQWQQDGGGSNGAAGLSGLPVFGGGGIYVPHGANAALAHRAWMAASVNTDTEFRVPLLEGSYIKAAA